MDLDGLTCFWSDALAYEAVHRDDSYVALKAKDGSRPTLVLQRVPEPKRTKNRMHLDVHTDDLDTDLARLLRLGADVISPERRDGNTRWVVLKDPEANEFCL